MRTRNKCYPYPVLTPYGDSYLKTSLFKVDRKTEKDGYTFRIILHPYVEDDGLRGLLKADEAELIYHIECPLSGYRKIFASKYTEDYVYQVPGKEISGRVQITPMIVAKKDISDFSLPTFAKDLKGMSFRVNMGDVLAAADTINLNVAKRYASETQDESIIQAFKNQDARATSMVVETQSKYIVVKIPQALFNTFKTFSNGHKLDSVFNEMVAVPALQQVILEMQENGADHYETFEWFPSVKKSIHDLFGIDVNDSSKFNTATIPNAFTMAQKMLNDPLAGALDELKATGGVRNE